jgi:hypothetical protein
VPPMPQDVLISGMGGLTLHAAAAAGGEKSWGSGAGSGRSSAAEGAGHHEFLQDPMRFVEQQDKY